MGGAISREPDPSTNSDSHSVEESISVRWRKKGNAIYVTASNDLSLTLQENRFLDAFNCYDKAYNLAANDLEKASAVKNLGQASKRLAEVYGKQHEKHIDIMVFYYGKAFKYFSIAYNDYATVMGASWTASLFALSLECLEDLKSGRITAETREVRINKYERIIKNVTMDALKAACYLELATLRFHKGVAALEEKNFKEGLNEMSECYFLIQEARRLKGDITELNVLEEDIRVQTAVGKAQQDIDAGFKLFHQVLYEEEHLNMDMVWHVLDLFRQAAIQSVDAGQTETEAIASYHIGVVYRKVLDMKQMAKQYFLKTVQLVLSMEPQNFDDEAWFRDCKAELEAIQQEGIAFQQSQWFKEREKLLKGELKADMKKLENIAKKNRWEFLEALYKTFPPHNPNHKLEGIDSKNQLPAFGTALKKIFLKACTHYHPDKINKDTDGKKLFVLTEEIAKVLNNLYNDMKC